MFGRVSDSFLRFTVRRQCKSSSALAAVDSGKRPKRQRIAKNERHAMVEAFIAKYRQSNAGKLPSTKHVQQMVGGSYYVIRDIVQEIEYSHKFAHANKIAIVQLEKTDEANEQNSDVKEDNSVSNLYESTGGMVNGQSSNMVRPGIEDKIGGQFFESVGTLISKKGEDIIGKANFQISEGEELSIVSAAESEAALSDEQGSDVKAESSTCALEGDKEIKIHVGFDPKGLSSGTGHKGKENVNKSSVVQAEPSVCSIKNKAVEVHHGLDTKEGLLSCSEDKGKEDVTRSSDSKGESTADDGDEILKYGGKSKDECLVSDTLDPHSRESVAKKDTVNESLNMTNMTDANTRTDLEEQTSNCPKKPDTVKKSNEDSSMGLLNNLRSIKDKIFSFWKNL